MTLYESVRKVHEVNNHKGSINWFLLIAGQDK